MRDHRRAIIICTHNLAEAEALADRIAIIRRGKIIALGTPAELKSRLLGPPLMELRFTRPISSSLATGGDGVVKLVSDLVRVETQGEDWLRYFTPAPQETNPLLLQKLASHEVGVVTLSAVQRSLEDVYLRVVQCPEPVEGEE